MNSLEQLFEVLADRVAQRVIEIQRAEARKNRTVLLTPKQMADRLGISEKTLANMRSAKAGPKFVKQGGRVRYPIEGEAT
jgi:AraC-like DNA-binding protein